MWSHLTNHCFLQTALLLPCLREETSLGGSKDKRKLRRTLRKTERERKRESPSHYANFGCRMLFPCTAWSRHSKHQWQAGNTASPWALEQARHTRNSEERGNRALCSRPEAPRIHGTDRAAWSWIIVVDSKNYRLGLTQTLGYKGRKEKGLPHRWNMSEAEKRKSQDARRRPAVQGQKRLVWHVRRRKQVKISTTVLGNRRCHDQGRNFNVIRWLLILEGQPGY